MFTDEFGQIFSQLKAGEYQLSFPEFVPMNINIQQNDTTKNVIDLAEIVLISR
ncbi:hypothetical protein BHECKSOX_480 [Bathymodiolus heckerae thiotrophic gill symbiont]|uniref:hypothetical protein n=1 Tax=Bathymodiolus heckerae thiotrophic gill symbiont TaxID=1052212 RepID=UPI0010B7ABF3|nr:hypothetical protein [Bathymodiolus heckerae thiotrophic gill symbiont]CAC9591435.1 hypothetical protein [uncultured Gammaproteobacteria bacterium]SHN90270.1 hypothetical protein BHECKSOX_480 [Bathymodiolus heckerae thiotrophic gill symbiont]